MENDGDADAVWRGYSGGPRPNGADGESAGAGAVMSMVHNPGNARRPFEAFDPWRPESCQWAELRFMQITGDPSGSIVFYQPESFSVDQ